MNNKNPKIAIIGMGYVGLPLAVEFGKIINTTGFDINQTRIQELIDVGVSAIIQPGGSINDKKVIEVANKAGIVMAFTAIRHFKH